MAASSASAWSAMWSRKRSSGPHTLMTATVPRDGLLGRLVKTNRVWLLFPAKLYCGQSLLDGRRESIVIDYLFGDEIEGWRDSRGRPYTWITPVVLEEGDAVVCLYVSATLVLLTRVLTCGLCRFSSHAVAVAQARFAARWHG